MGRRTSAKNNGSKKQKSNGAGFEQTLWLAADKMRKNIDAAEYKHIALGLIFLKYISDSFESLHNKLIEGKGEYKGADPEDADEYRAENVFFVPATARWSYLHSRSKLPSIGKDVDNAMEAIEKENPTLKGILPKVFARPNLDKASLGGLIDLIGNIALGDEAAKSKDLLGKIYEYFLGEFALAEGKKGGQFYTPKSIVRLMVEMIEPYKGRVFDPCCGSGGMFVMSEKFVESHQGRIDDISIYGQESNQTTYRLCRMNLAIRQIDGSQVKWNNEGSFLNDAHKDLKADFILANPPFNDSDWSGELLQKDGRWKYGVPSAGNANFAWVQHFIYHLSPKGTAGFVLANLSLASESTIENEIRKGIIEKDIVDCIVTLPGKLFYSQPNPVCLWFVTRDKNGNGYRHRVGEILLIDASKLGVQENRTYSSLSDDDIQKISSIYHDWKHKVGKYKDRIGFCKSVSIEEVRKGKYSLFPGQYVGIDHTEKILSTAQVSKDLFLLWDRYKELNAELKAASNKVKGNMDCFAPAMNLHMPSKFIKIKLEDVLKESREVLGNQTEPEILTCTEKAGLIFQKERFAKRIATDNTSKYKIVRKTDIVYNPYLLWAGAIDQCWIVDIGITSPAYEVLKIKPEFDPTLIGLLLKSKKMIKTYDGISVGTIQRRRRAPIEKFLALEVILPSLEDQKIFNEITSYMQEEVGLLRVSIRKLSELISFLATAWLSTSDKFASAETDEGGNKSERCRKIVEK